jgi:hypothetical protein
LTIHCYSDTGDKGSIGNLGRHTEGCWGEAAVQRAKELFKLEDVMEGVIKPLQRYGTLPSAFNAQGKKNSFLHMAHTPAEIQ